MNIGNIGVSALKAAQAGLAVTANNIANMNTPGYSRQEVIQQSGGSQNTGSGFFGQGVNVQTVIRRYDQFLNNQVQQTRTTLSGTDAELTLSQQVESILSDEGSGISSGLQDVFNSASNAATNQTQAARIEFQSNANSLINRFDNAISQLDKIKGDATSKITQSVTNVNSIARQIAKVNDLIVKSQSADPLQPPNTLMDQRDQLVNELSKEVRVSTTLDTDGALNVFVGEGNALVVGAIANNVTPDQFTSNSGGNIGGNTSFRDGALSNMRTLVLNLKTAFTNNVDPAQANSYTTTQFNDIASLDLSYSQIPAQIGTKTKELLSNSQSQTIFFNQVQAQAHSVSGVNIDEEAANLLKYQQAYQAAAKAVQISQSMFDSLLQLGG